MIFGPSSLSCFILSILFFFPAPCSSLHSFHTHPKNMFIFLSMCGVYGEWVKFSFIYMMPRCVSHLVSPAFTQHFQTLSKSMGVFLVDISHCYTISQGGTLHRTFHSPRDSKYITPNSQKQGCRSQLSAECRGTQLFPSAF